MASCVLWPGFDDPNVLPKREAAGLQVARSGREILSVAQVLSSRDAKDMWVGGLLWPAGLALARWADCAGDFWSFDGRPKMVLEVFAGVALPSLVAQSHGAEVVATDFSLRALRAMGRSLRNGTKRLRLNMRQAAALHSAGELFEGTFDVVLMSAGFRTAEDTEEIWRFLARALAPCGLLIVASAERHLAFFADAQRA
ncbi:unnamed protein product [Effrenium voratum]|nr:unnamed protein product [Effrenium voratum]